MRVELVKIYNFVAGKDDLKTTHGGGTDVTAVTTTTAASILTGALGTNISGSDLTAGSVTGTFLYNGDLFFLELLPVKRSTVLLKLGKQCSSSLVSTISWEVILLTSNQ